MKRYKVKVTGAVETEVEVVSPDFRSAMKDALEAAVASCADKVQASALEVRVVGFSTIPKEEQW